MKCSTIMISAAIMCLLASSAMAFNKTAEVIGSGATNASNATMHLQGTVGQAVIGTTLNAAGRNEQGFWHPANAHASGIMSPAAGLLAGFTLDQNYPNPFNPAGTTTIHFTAPYSAHVVLNVYTMTGKLVQTLLDADVSEGGYSLNLDAGMLPSGNYLYALQSRGQALTKQLTIVR